MVPTSPPGWPDPPIAVTLLVRETGWLGAAVYVGQLADGVVSAAEIDGDVVTVGTLRQRAADVRVPAGVMSRAGPAASRTMGRALWGRKTNVHRTNFTIPPAPSEIVSILDLAPLHFPDEGPFPPSLRDQARRARGAVVLSDTIGDEVRSELGVERVWVVPPAVGNRFYGVAPPRPSGPDYVLHIGGASRRKGLDLLAGAWPGVAAHEPSLHLVLAGPPHSTGRTELLTHDRASYVGQPSDAELVGLMAHARAVVVPSFYEGFGMPVAEAMALGTPAVVMRGGAAAEVAGSFGFGFARGDGSDGLAAALLDAVQARDRRPDLLLAGTHRAHRWNLSETRCRQVGAYRDAFGS